MKESAFDVADSNGERREVSWSCYADQQQAGISASVADPRRRGCGLCNAAEPFRRETNDLARCGDVDSDCSESPLTAPAGRAGRGWPDIGPSRDNTRPTKLHTGRSGACSDGKAP